MAATVEMDAIKTKMRMAWEVGDHGTFATHVEPGAVDLLKA